LEDEDPIEHYLQVLADKTGSLIAAAAHYGTILAGASAQVEAAAVAYAEKVGVAFQLADDVIDLVSDAATTGKTPGTDLREGVPTMPVLLLRRAAAAGELDQAGRQLVADLDGDLSDDDVLADVLGRLNAHPVLEQARLMARTWATEAVEELAVLPASPTKEALGEFAHRRVARRASLRRPPWCASALLGGREACFPPRRGGVRDTRQRRSVCHSGLLRPGAGERADLHLGVLGLVELLGDHRAQPAE